MKSQFWGPLVVGAVLAAVLGLTACASTTTGSAREVTIKATDFRFEPASIQVPVGQSVRLILKNDGQVLHDVAVVGLEAEMHEEKAESGHAEEAGHDADEMMKVHADAAPGKAETIEFTPTKAGNYQLTCTLPGHKEAGMVGEMTVQ